MKRTLNNITTATTSIPAIAATGVETRKPGALRRTALVVVGFVALALPTMFAINISRMLLTGVESDHRFHQLTGQGLPRRWHSPATRTRA